jgi:hypothetical protein
MKPEPGGKAEARERGREGGRKGGRDVRVAAWKLHRHHLHLAPEVPRPIDTGVSARPRQAEHAGRARELSRELCSC